MNGTLLWPNVTQYHNYLVKEKESADIIAKRQKFNYPLILAVKFA